MTWWGLVVVVLASYRLTRVVTRDTISLPFRDWLYGRAWDDSTPEVDPHNPSEFRASPRGFVRTWLYELLTCPLCLGVWVSAAVYSAWRWWDVTAVHAVIGVFAVAGAQCFLALHEGDD